MEELTSILENTGVTKTPCDTAKPHPRYSDHKTKKGFGSQEERRRRFLQLQKTRRVDFVNFARKLADNDTSPSGPSDGGEAEEDDEDQDEDEEKMDCVEKKMKKLPRQYKDQLMMSEWLVEVPDDFESNYYMVVCPVGKRNLVVASNALTRVYTKSGYRVRKFPSNLPGGNRSAGGTCTVLDTIYHEPSRTYYVLDVMCWNGPFYECETEFRFFWLQNKMSENIEVQQYSKRNPYKFVPLSAALCTKENMTNELALSRCFDVDGVLFYHKLAHYLFGSTPLVGWLKPYMMPDILGVPVPEQLLKDKPMMTDSTTDPQTTGGMEVEVNSESSTAAE